jgi:hypothetical protein
MNLVDLGPETRRYMCDEIALDEERGAIYEEPRLRPGVFGRYIHLLKEAAALGTPADFADAIRTQRLLVAMESRSRGSARVPRIAANVLADTEFNRYYVRALCRRAMAEGFALEVYRARMVKKPRLASERRIGEKLAPEPLLRELRDASDRSPSPSGVPGGWNSGLSVRLVPAEALTPRNGKATDAHHAGVVQR